MNAVVTRRLTVVVATLALFAAFAVRAADTQDPGKLVEGVASDVLKALDARRAELRKEPAKIRKLVDEFLLPHFDTEYAARLAFGPNWRNASQEQRKRFIEAFYQSLLKNYGESLLDFTPERMNIQPYRGKPDDKTATVRTEIRRDNGTRVPVNYSLRKTDAGWKAYDVTIEGISYITTVKRDIGAEVNQKGIEAVIQRLEAQVAGAATK